ncbi:uncharacterized protein LOC143201695 isoform X2 [Rhynchophorus ferrugineus]|uniref:uncharacterized protein LOC143201695 isoform X2 n=1 Tax=Rhynchophorus ferrugineus TaxID=354439 RepID=UPI003FCDAA75
MSDSPDREEVVRCLKEANIYEENMSEDLMTSYYQAIKNSENSLKEELEGRDEEDNIREKSLYDSASELLEAINNSESVAPSNISKSLSESDDEALLDGEGTEDNETQIENEKNNNSTNMVVDDMTEIENETPIGFNEMPETDIKYPLNIVTHPLKHVNIQNSEKFLTSDKATRIKMLYDYDMAMSRLEAHYARLSKKLAPLKPQIKPSRNQLSKQNVSLSLPEVQPPETYVSRSGRLTKRKVIIENDDSNEEIFFKSKKSKSDGEWMSKESSKAKTPKTATKKAEPAENNIRADTPVLDKFDELKGNASTPVSRPRTYHKRLTNEEIMSRSCLFTDTPTGKRTRGQQLLMAGKAEAEKQKEREDEMEKFANSLVVDSENLDEENSESIIVPDEEKVFERRRVVPPRPAARKSIHSRKKAATAGTTPLNITTKMDEIEEESPETTKNSVVSRKPSTVDVQSKPSTSSASSPTTTRLSKQQMNMVQCPLCTVFFHRRKIEEHASTCGEESFNRANQEKMSRISCSICDTIIPFNTSYEVHVKECIAKQNGI